MSGDFTSIAPNYWAAGLSVVPIKPGTKNAAVMNWPAYAGSLPSEVNRANWLRSFAGYGIGVLLGFLILEDQYLNAVDVDDDRL
ncbi:hypothetical protein VF02_38125, partial [Nostoc linckia z1]|uniref:bifunctional DNA primase/polymerase n=1 Tax=Nostoc linckia TaxID=92942 RepID=UPI000C02FB19